MPQKFKSGNKVRLLYGKLYTDAKKGVVDVLPDQVGREAVIEGSYFDLYGGIARDNMNSYSIVFLDNGGSSAWHDDDQLELVEEGGLHLMEEAMRTRERVREENRDLKRIVAGWPKTGDNTDTMLYLFEKIEFKTSFLANGEFFVLMADWAMLRPMIDILMTAQTEDIAVYGIREDKREIIRKFWHEIQQAKHDNQTK